MRRKTLRIVPVDSDVSYSSSSTDSIYHTSPTCDPFYKIMRNNRIDAGSPYSYGSGGWEDVPNNNNIITTDIGYNKRIDLQNNRAKNCCFLAIISLFCGVALA